MSAAAHKRLSEGDTVVVYTAMNEVEGELAKDAIEDAGIPCLLVPHKDAGLDGAFAAQKGWGSLRVMADDAERAARLIEEALEPIEDDLDGEAPDPDDL